MRITNEMIEELREQIRNAGVHMTNSTYVFHGKREDLILANRIMLVVDSNGEEALFAKRKATAVMQRLGPVRKDDDHFYEIIHMILRANGQKGFSEQHDPLIPRLNEVIDSNNHGF